MEKHWSFLLLLQHKKFGVNVCMAANVGSSNSVSGLIPADQLSMKDIKELQMYRISSKDSAPPIFRHLVAEMCTKPPNFGKRFGSLS